MKNSLRHALQAASDKTVSRLIAATSAAFLIVSTLVPLPATSSPTCEPQAGAIVVCDESGQIKAKAPISNAGVISQTITMSIDPTKTALGAANQIVAPSGWTVFYSSNAGNTWSSSSPTTSTAWAAVNAIKAEGTLKSEGATAEGKQIATGAATAIAPPSGSFSGGGGGGDGWDVFFDDNNHVFYVYHHGMSPGEAAINCKTRTGGSCGPGWPFSVAVSPFFYTNSKSTGWVDLDNEHLWINTNNSTQSGFLCIDIANFTTGPTWCGSSAQNSFVALHPSGATAYDQTLGLAASGTRLFTLKSGTDELLCLDTALNNGLGGPCGTGRLDVLPGYVSYGAAWGTAEIIAHDGRIYGVLGQDASDGRLFCVDAATFTNCANWPKNTGFLSSNVFLLPDASGQVVAICALKTGGFGANSKVCFTPQGNSYTAPAALNPLYVPNYHYAKNPETYKSRIYWSDGGYTGGFIFCFDMATNDWCPNWGGSSGKSDANYTLTIDPYNPSCIWTNDHQTQIKTWDATTGNNSCTSLPADVTFDASVIVPRLGCDGTNAVAAWRKFNLTGPTSAKYTSATLTVTTETGQPISNWTDIPITEASGVREIDLSALTPAASGQHPKFIVKFVGRTGSSPGDDAKATVTAIGDSPELCITPQMLYPCPTALGPVTSLPLVSAVVGAGGSATLTGNVSEAFSSASASIPVTTPNLSTCASTLTGAAVAGGSGLPVVGATVSLLDSSGTPVTQNGTPVTTTTAANGTYSFGTLALGTYRVKFADIDADTTAMNSAVTSGGSGTTTAQSNAVVSSTSRLVASTNGVVNATYSLPPQPISRTMATGAGQTVSFDVFAAFSGAALLSGQTSSVSASTGGNFTSTKGSTRLCSNVEIAPSCSATAITFANEGTYRVNTSSGVITFDPLPSFLGASTPIRYAISDSASKKAAGTLSARVLPAPQAQPDTGTGPWNTPVSRSAIANDGDGISGSTLRLCSSGQVPNNCTATTLTIANQGTYSVSSGVITFIPLSSFSGVATPATYQVQDAIGQYASSTYTPTISSPPPPTASAQTRTLAAGSGQTATFTSLDRSNGLARPAQGGPTLSPSATCFVNAGSCSANAFVTPNGTFTLNGSTGVVTFTPSGTTFSAVSQSVTYRVTDQFGQVVESTLTVLLPVPPIAVNDSSAGYQDQNQVLNPLANDQTFNGFTKSPATLYLCGLAPSAESPPSCTKTAMTISGQGVYSVNQNTGAVTFDPEPTFIGSVTPITYQFADSAGSIASASIAIAVSPVPAPVVPGPVCSAPLNCGSPATSSESIVVNPTTSPTPAAASDSKTGKMGSAVMVNPLANDQMAGSEFAPSTLRLCSSESCDLMDIETDHGTWRVLPNGMVEFMPKAEFFGQTSISYWVLDLAGNAVNATISIVIEAPGGELADTGDSKSAMTLALGLMLMLAGGTLLRFRRTRRSN